MVVVPFDDEFPRVGKEEGPGDVKPGASCDGCRTP